MLYQANCSATSLFTSDTIMSISLRSFLSVFIKCSASRWIPTQQPFTKIFVALKQRRQKHIVKTAFSLISKYLNYAHIYCTYDKSKKQLSFNADSFCPIDVYYNDKLLLANHSGINFTEDLKLIQSNKEFKIGVNQFNEKKLMFINSITKDTIKQHVYVNFIDSN